MEETVKIKMLAGVNYKGLDLPKGVAADVPVAVAERLISEKQAVAVEEKPKTEKAS